MKVVASGWKIANQIGQQKKSVTQSRSLLGETSIANLNPKTQSWATFWWLYIWNPTSRGWLVCVKVCSYMYKLGIISIVYLKNKLPCISYKGFYTSKFAFALKVVKPAPSSAFFQRRPLAPLLGSATLTDTWRSALPIDVVSGLIPQRSDPLTEFWGSFTLLPVWRVSKICQVGRVWHSETENESMEPKYQPLFVSVKKYTPSSSDIRWARIPTDSSGNSPKFI